MYIHIVLAVFLSPLPHLVSLKNIRKVQTLVNATLKNIFFVCSGKYYGSCKDVNLNLTVYDAYHM